MHHQWEQGGLLQWGALAGLVHTAARAEDVAAMAACLAPGPVTLAVDNQGTADFLQEATRQDLTGSGPGHQAARDRHGVRTAIERIVHDNGIEAVSAIKVKAHIATEEPTVDIVAPLRPREGNARADKETARGMTEHPVLLREFVDVREKRGPSYLTFSEHLARLMIGVARKAGTGIKAMLEERTLPEAVFGRKKMARALPLGLHAAVDHGDDQAGEDQTRSMSIGDGPLGPTRWARHPSFLGKFRSLWEATRWRERAKGQLGTPWLELWIGYELEQGPVPERADGSTPGLLAPLPTAGSSFRTFTTVPRALLRAALEPEEWQSWMGRGTRGLAYRHLAVASTLSTMGMCITWSVDTQREINIRVLRLRGVTQHQCRAIVEGREVRALVRAFCFQAPPPWHCRGGNLASMEEGRDPLDPSSGAASKKRKVAMEPDDRQGGMELRLFCPWASCAEVASKQIHPQLLGLGAGRKAQVYCRGCAARCTLAAAICAQCHKNPRDCSGHDWLSCPPPYAVPRGRRPGQWRPGKGRDQMSIEQALRGGHLPLQAATKLGERPGEDPISQWREADPTDGNAQGLKRGRGKPGRDSCTYSCLCQARSGRNAHRALGCDSVGGLVPLRCKICGVAQRPREVRCVACDCPWELCPRGPVRGRQTRHPPTPARTGGGTTHAGLTFATDFSGMDMVAFAMDDTVIAGIPTRHIWACDSWAEARDFARRNHRPEKVFTRVEERPIPDCPVTFYIAGPPCQPWARGGKARGEEDPRAELFDCSVQLIMCNRPLAFILEESDKIPTYQQGRWWRRRVEDALQHGVPQNRLRLWVVGLRRDTPGADTGFQGLEALPTQLCLTLKDILDPREESDSAEKAPAGQGAARNVAQARDEAIQKGLLGDWMVTQQVGRAWSESVRPRTIMPCLLHSNKNGSLIGSRGRTARVSERSRAQGLPAARAGWPKDAIAYALLGNFMARPILQRLIHKVLRIRNVVEGPDPWEMEAQRVIKEEAAGRQLTPPSARRHPLAAQRLGMLTTLQTKRHQPEGGDPRAVVADGALAVAFELAAGGGCGATPGGTLPGLGTSPRDVVVDGALAGASQLSVGGGCGAILGQAIRTGPGEALPRLAVADGALAAALEQAAGGGCGATPGGGSPGRRQGAVARTTHGTSTKSGEPSVGESGSDACKMLFPWHGGEPTRLLRDKKMCAPRCTRICGRLIYENEQHSYYFQEQCEHPEGHGDNHRFLCTHTLPPLPPGGPPPEDGGQHGEGTGEGALGLRRTPRSRDELSTQQRGRPAEASRCPGICRRVVYEDYEDDLRSYLCQEQCWHPEGHEDRHWFHCLRTEDRQDRQTEEGAPEAQSFPGRAPVAGPLVPLLPTMGFSEDPRTGTSEAGAVATAARAAPGRAEDPRKGAGAEATAGEAEGIGSGHGSSTPRPCKPARPPSERTGSAAARGESPLAEAVAVGGSGTPHIPCTVLDDEEGATPGCCSKVEGGIDDDVGEGPCTILEDDPGDEERSEGADTTIPAIWRSQGAGLQPSQKGHGELLAAQAQRAQLGNQPTKNNFPCKVGEPTFHARLHNKSSHHEETGEALQASGTSYRGGGQRAQ